jgi:phosphate transport system substrate-binding protein
MNAKEMPMQALRRAALAAGIVFPAAVASAAVLDPALPRYAPQAVAPSPNATYVARDGAVRIVGTEVMDHVIEQLDARFAETHPGTRFAPTLKGTSAAMPALTHGVTAFAPMGRAMTWVEKVPYEKVVGTLPIEVRIAHGSVANPKKANVLAVFVNKANPVDRLTAEQVARIFAAGHAKGDITQWSQAGVKGAIGKQPIHTYGAGDDGGFGQYMLATHMNGLRFRKGHERLPDSKQIVERVGDDAAGIGVAALAYLTPEVKVVAIAPAENAPYSRGEADDVGAGRYPYDRYVYFYVRREPGQPVDPFVKEYLKLVLSQEGQRIIASEADGYVPLNAREVAEELAKLD